MANIKGRWTMFNPVVQSMDQPSTHQQFSGRDDQPTPTMSMVHPIKNRQRMKNFKIWQNGKKLSNFKIFIHRNRRIYHQNRVQKLGSWPVQMVIGFWWKSSMGKRIDHLSRRWSIGLIDALGKGEYETGRPPLNKVINRVDVIVELGNLSIGWIHQLTDGCHEVINAPIDAVNLGGEVIIRPAICCTEVDGFHPVIQGVYRVIESFQPVISVRDIFCRIHDHPHIGDVGDLLVERVL